EPSTSASSAVSRSRPSDTETCDGRYHSSSSFDEIVHPPSSHQWQVFHASPSSASPSKSSSKRTAHSSPWRPCPNGSPARSSTTTLAAATAMARAASTTGPHRRGRSRSPEADQALHRAPGGSVHPGDRQPLDAHLVVGVPGGPPALLEHREVLGLAGLAEVVAGAAR